MGLVGRVRQMGRVGRVGQMGRVGRGENCELGTSCKLAPAGDSTEAFNQFDKLI
jgi:hypothetical protein